MDNLKSILISTAIFLTALAIVCSFPLVSNWNQDQISKITNKNNFCFAVVGDTNNNIAAFSKLADSLNKNCSFIVINGNLVSYGTNEEYYLALNQIKKINLPAIVVIGDHEILSGSKLIFEEIFGETYFSFNNSNNLFVILDNSLGYVDAKQYNWLKNELNKNYENKIVIMHAPWRDMNISPNGKNLEELFKTKNVSLVISTRANRYTNFSKDRVNYLIVGSSGGITNESFSYAKVCINHNNIKIDNIEFDKENKIEQLFNTLIWPGLIFGYKILLIGIVTYLGLEFLKHQRRN